MLTFLIVAGLAAAASGDTCLGTTSGSHHAIGCVANQGCCQYGLVIASRCSGSKVCCYTSDICGSSHSSGGSCLSTSEMTALENKLIEYEGIRYTAYDAQPSNSYVDWTVCVGFNLKRSDARSVFSSVLPGVSFDSVYGGHTSLSRSQCMALFGHDLTATYIPRAQQVAGSQFCGLPVNVKIALVSAVYRGDLAYSHKTAQYMRAGNWCAVPSEYLNYYQYTHCHQLGIPGVCTRMKWNADQFQTMCHNG